MTTREALEKIATMELLSSPPYDGTPLYTRMREIAREALAEPEPEPINWRQNLELIAQVAELEQRLAAISQAAEKVREWIKTPSARAVLKSYRPSGGQYVHKPELFNDIVALLVTIAWNRESSLSRALPPDAAGLPREAVAREQAPPPIPDPILDGAFDHKPGCRGADYGECTCGAAGAGERREASPLKCEYCVDGTIWETDWTGAEHDRPCSECSGTGKRPAEPCADQGEGAK